MRGSDCVRGSVRVCVLWLPVADGCNFPTSISFPGLAMNKLCELFGQGPGAHPFGGSGSGGVAADTHKHTTSAKSHALRRRHKIKLHQQSPAARTGRRTSPKIDSIMGVRVCRSVCVCVWCAPLLRCHPTRKRRQQ